MRCKLPPNSASLTDASRGAATSHPDMNEHSKT